MSDSMRERSFPKPTEDDKKAKVLKRLQEVVWQEDAGDGDCTPKPFCIFCGPDWGMRHKPDCEYLLINPDAPVRER
jgi:hypothetical protein